MKNFPHQYSDFTKFRRTLGTIEDLNSDGEDVGDDGILGYELTRRGINTLRERPDLPLEDRIALIQAKPIGSQGPRTAARDLRRTLRLLGWLDPGWGVTAEGDALLGTDVNSEEERALWQQALLDLSLEDGDGNVSHPVRILLRLVHAHEIVERQGAELALEARDDSEGEFERVAALVEIPEEDRVAAMDSSIAAVRNARKILTALAEQANLIYRASRSAPYQLTGVGRAALGEGFEGRAVALEDSGVDEPRRTPRTRGAPRRAEATSIRSTSGNPDGWRSLTHEEQVAATRLRFERTVRHQELVATLLERLEGRDAEFHEDSASFDLLLVAPGDGPLILFEIKTLESDELTQTRLAIGQLFSYSFLNVRSRWPGRDVRLAVLYEREIEDDLLALLDEIGIAALTLDDERGLRALNNAAKNLPL